VKRPEPEKYRPDEEWDSKALAVERSAVHDSSADLYAWCPRGCGERFSGPRSKLFADMQSHLESKHGAS